MTRHFSIAAFVTASAALFFGANASEAGLIVNTWDGRSAYPTSAPVLTSPDLPLLGPPATANAASQGVRLDRTQVQTFDVSSPISVESIFIGYRINPDVPNIVNIRLLAIPNVNATYVSPTVLATINVTTPTPYGGSGERYNALRLDWVDSNPLILTPQDGVAGYGLELIGQNPPGSSIPNTSSPIAWIYRTNNPYAEGRGINFASAPPGANDDWVMAITGQYVPEPSTLMLSMLCAAVGCMSRRGRKIHAT